MGWPSFVGQTVDSQRNTPPPPPSSIAQLNLLVVAHPLTIQHMKKHSSKNNGIEQITNKI
jgi:hypothetical protein